MGKKQRLALDITRSNGLDGFSVMLEHYIDFLKNDYEVLLITGRHEEKYGVTDGGYEIEQVDDLFINHPHTILLRENQFKEQYRKENFRKGKDGYLTEGQWDSLFHEQNNRIHSKLEKLIEGQDIFFHFGFLGLRYLHPAAALASKKIIGEWIIPQKSNGADPMGERPQTVDRILPRYLNLLAANDSTPRGLYNFPHLDHIAINHHQFLKFHQTYRIPIDQVFEIPDFIPLKHPHIHHEMGFDASIYTALQEGRIITNGLPDLTEKTVYFVSPVRTIERKQLIEAMNYAKYYGEVTGQQVHFVMTHPKTDGQEYFERIISHAKENKIDISYLGDSITHKSLRKTLTQLAKLNSIMVVASNAGAMENAIIEGTEYGFPELVSCLLNSAPIFREKGFQFHEMTFQNLESEGPDMVSYINNMLYTDMRMQHASNNIRVTYDHFSTHANAEKIREMITHKAA